VRTPAAAVLLVALVALVVPADARLVIAVVDSGVDDEHPELAGRVERVSFTGDPDLPTLPGVPDRDDPDGHGTATASMAAGAGLGADPEAGILDLQVRSTPSNLPLDSSSEDAAARALDYVLRNPGTGAEGTRVVLLSFADAGLTDAGVETLRAEAEALFDAGIAVIVPDGPRTALHEDLHVLLVAAAGACASGSREAGKPDLAARESGTVASPSTGPADPAPTTSASGTHVAAARVAGAASRMFVARPDLPVAAVYDLLRDTADDLGDAGPDGCGFGEVNPEAAVQAAASWSDPADIPQPEGHDTPAPAGLVFAAVAVAFALRRRA
jgi:MYXO-CTERM domain-containing protein